MTNRGRRWSLTSGPLTCQTEKRKSKTKNFWLTRCASWRRLLQTVHYCYLKLLASGGERVRRRKWCGNGSNNKHVRIRITISRKWHSCGFLCYNLLTWAFKESLDTKNSLYISRFLPSWIQRKSFIKGEKKLRLNWPLKWLMNDNLFRCHFFMNGSKTRGNQWMHLWSVLWNSMCPKTKQGKV